MYSKIRDDTRMYIQLFLYNLFFNGSNPYSHTLTIIVNKQRKKNSAFRKKGNEKKIHNINTKWFGITYFNWVM